MRRYRPTAEAGVGAATPFARSTPTRFPLRLARCVVGLAICGLGVALMYAADAGLGPWDVLHKGLSRHAGIGVGTMIIIVGFALLVAFIPLRVRPGLGTVLNAVLIGGVVNAVGDRIPEPDQTVLQLLQMSSGVVAFGLGTALYIGAGLGPGPRDGLMTGIAARGYSLRVVRTLLELSVLAAGWLLGGSVGVGTVVFALAIGPLVQLFLTVLGTQTARPPVAAVAAD